MNEYLDEIVVNLYFQISKRFGEFMDIILNLNKMNQEIDNSLKNIL
jgi:hypothetical protein